MNLNFKLTKEDFTTIKTDLLIIECKKLSENDKKPGSLLKNDGGVQLDNELNGLISQIIKDENFTGELGKTKVINTHGKIGAKNILVIGAGEDKEFKLDSLRQIGAKISSEANELKAKSVTGVLEPGNINNLKPEERLQSLVEGLILGGYRFERYKDKKQIEKATFKSLNIIHKGGSSSLNKSIEYGKEIALAINFARDLVNGPGYDINPATLAREAQRIARTPHLTCKILDERGLTKENMRLIKAVSQGALNGPKLIHLKYKPSKKAKAKIAILGKGVTFDSGGYNLKPSRHIETMKCDMAGAAAVLGTMMLLPLVKPNVEVHGIIPASENMIDGKSHKPGDIIKSRSGKTVEIVNTDAEGRLLLADAIDYANQLKPDIMIDLATLTGGVRYALGEIYTAILGNDQKLIDKLIEASKEAGEPTWQLPLEMEYLKGFKEASIADLNNTGKSYAMTITGALFLHEFVGETKWAHLDIAESAWMDEPKDYHPKGGTGAGIQTLVKFLQSY